MTNSAVNTFAEISSYSRIINFNLCHKHPAAMFTRRFSVIYFLVAFLSILAIAALSEEKGVQSQKRAEEAIAVMKEAANVDKNFNVVLAPTVRYVHLLIDAELGEIYIVVDCDFIDKVSDDELLFLIGHEVSHIALSHLAKPDKAFATKEAEADFNSWKLMKEKLGKDFDAVAFVKKWLPQEQARIGELEALIESYIKDTT
ncbi:MAG TPA: M48 family metalloprotease [Candidatus Hypogeohydataceae bacterium YC41]